jgi:ABC-type glycerol-3-phosphate transport system permease component
MDETNVPLLMAASVLMAAPVVLMFVGIQRLFLRDLSLGRGTDGG